mmetsp:Transcript_62128/g.175789  ORF Transcript_62128/g.175789 Transcript_62128/m.175789 type:complete len:227 (-) Transcript_62128:465-1145(-)
MPPDIDRARPPPRRQIPPPSLLGPRREPRRGDRWKDPVSATSWPCLGAPRRPVPPPRPRRSYPRIWRGGHPHKLRRASPWRSGAEPPCRDHFLAQSPWEDPPRSKWMLGDRRCKQHSAHPWRSDAGPRGACRLPARSPRPRPRWPRGGRPSKPSKALPWPVRAAPRCQARRRPAVARLAMRPRGGHPRLRQATISGRGRASLRDRLCLAALLPAAPHRGLAAAIHC